MEDPKNPSLDASKISLGQGKMKNQETLSWWDEGPLLSKSCCLKDLLKQRDSLQDRKAKGQHLLLPWKHQRAATPPPNWMPRRTLLLLLQWWTVRCSLLLPIEWQGWNFNSSLSGRHEEWLSSSSLEMPRSLSFSPPKRWQGELSSFSKWGGLNGAAIPYRVANLNGVGGERRGPYIGFQRAMW